jgi:hypothetical protein
MRPSNPPRNVALHKNLESVVIAAHLLEKPPYRAAAIRRLASVKTAFGARCRTASAAQGAVVIKQQADVPM